MEVEASRIEGRELRCQNCDEDKGGEQKEAGRRQRLPGDEAEDRSGTNWSS